MYKSLYPSEDLQNNISATTQIGMVQIDHQVYKNEHPFPMTEEELAKWTRGGSLLEDFQSGNVIEYCKRWLHFSGFMELMDDIIEYFYQLNITPIRLYCEEYRPMVMDAYGDGERPMIRLIAEGDNGEREMIGMVYKPTGFNEEIYKSYIQ